MQLREERVNVDRRAVDRALTDADRKDYVVIEVTEMREEPVEERTETVRDTVRRRVVEVERSDTHTDDSTTRRQSR